MITFLSPQWNTLRWTMAPLGFDVYLIIITRLSTMLVLFLKYKAKPTWQYIFLLFHCLTKTGIWFHVRGDILCQVLSLDCVYLYDIFFLTRSFIYCFVGAIYPVVSNLGQFIFHVGNRLLILFSPFQMMVSRHTVVRMIYCLANLKNLSSDKESKAYAKMYILHFLWLYLIVCSGWFLPCFHWCSVHAYKPITILTLSVLCLWY